MSEALVEFGILEEFKVDDYYAWFISANNCDGNDQIGALRRSIELKSDFAPAWLMRGRAHAKAGRWELALTDFTRAVELDSDSDIACFEQSRAHIELGLLDEAMSDLANVRGRNPKVEPSSYEAGNAGMNWQTGSGVVVNS